MMTRCEGGEQMHWFRMVSKRKNRNMALSILGLAIGATAWSISRRKNNRSTIWTPLRRMFR